MFKCEIWYWLTCHLGSGVSFINTEQSRHEIRLVLAKSLHIICCGMLSHTSCSAYTRSLTQLRARWVQVAVQDDQKKANNWLLRCHITFGKNIVESFAPLGLFFDFHSRQQHISKSKVWNTQIYTQFCIFQMLIFCFLCNDHGRTTGTDNV